MEASVVASPVAAASSIAESRAQFKGKYSYNSLHFPGDGDKFRGRLASAKEKVILWLEDKASKGQWQCEIDVAKCGPAGEPGDLWALLLSILTPTLLYRNTRRNSHNPSSCKALSSCMQLYYQ